MACSVKVDAVMRTLKSPLLVLLLGLLWVLAIPLSAAEVALRVGVYERKPLAFAQFAEKESYISGLYVELLDSIARQDQWKLSFTRLTAPQEGRNRLINGEIDLLAGVAVTSAEAALLDFSKRPLITLWDQVYVRTLDAANLRNPLDLHNKTIAVGANDATALALEKLCDSFQIHCQIQRVADETAALAALASGAVEAAVAHSLYPQIEAVPPELRASPLIFNPTGYHVAALRGKHSPLLARIDHYLGQWANDVNSDYFKSRQQWLPTLANPQQFCLDGFSRGQLLALWLGSVLLGGLLMYGAGRWHHRKHRAAPLPEQDFNARSEHKYRALVENVPYGLEELDTSGTIVFANAADHQLRRYNPGELTGRSILDMVASNTEREELKRYLENLLKEQPEHPPLYYSSIIRKDGKPAEIRMEWHYKREAHGKISGLYAVISDVTGMRETKDRIRTYHQDLKRMADERASELLNAYNDLLITAAVFESTTEAILVLSLEGHLQTSNPAFTHITGYSRDSIVGQPFTLLASKKHSQDIYPKLWEQLTKQGAWQGEVWNQRQNGDAYPGWLTMNAVKNTDGEVTQYVALLSDITKRKQFEQQIWRQANFDALTKLPNRHLFHRRLEQAIGFASNKGTQAALMFIDLDHFKEVNDTLGHDAGDELLIAVTARLSTAVRKNDTVARMGGDEFTVILPQIDGPPTALKIAQQILACLIKPFPLSQGEVQISGSIGIVIYPDDGHNFTTLLKNADIAMYKIKGTGRNGYALYADLQKSV